MRRSIAKPLSLIAFFLAAFTVQAPADNDEQFYKSRPLTLTVGVDVGGGYDQYARLLSRHLAKHIPGGPTILVQNLPGSGGVRAAQKLFSVSPRDGSELGMIYRGIATMPLLGKITGFDPLKFNWIGSMNEETDLCVSWHTSSVKTFADLLKRELIVGTTGVTSATGSIISAMNTLLGAKFKLVPGYKGSADMDLSMMRGEINGRCGVSWNALVTQHPDWLVEKKVNVLVQLGFRPRPELPGVPLLQTFAKTPDDKLVLDLMLAPQLMAYPLLAPPDVPKSRIDVLREAFNATITDPELIEEANKHKINVQLVRGEDVTALLERSYAASPSVIEMARQLVNGGK